MTHIFNNKTKYIFLILCITILSDSCKKDAFLNVEDVSAVTSTTTWSSQSAADLFLNDIYNSLPDMNNQQVFDPIENWSDNSMCGFNWAPSATVIAQEATTLNSGSDVGVNWTGTSGQAWLYWASLYGNIRKCNVFIQGIQSSTSLPASYASERIGEARVLRAFFYQYLWILYGRVPVITVPDDLTTEGNGIFHPQSSIDSTYTFLINELDSAIQELPPNTGNSGNGRITQGAALTLKGWIQLYYASPLDNPNNDLSRWASAATTNQQVMSMGYSLYSQYGGLFFTTGNINNEGIFYHEYLGPKQGSDLVGFQGPNNIGAGPTYLSWGGVDPTQDLVDDYSMDNGKAITDPGSGYDATHPYVNREPRFYQSILYNGSTFDGQIYTCGLNYGNNPLDMSDANDNTNTGYNLKKGMDTTVNIFQSGASSQNYYYFRYAEVLLNYAEAQNEAVGPDASVYSALDQIRTRAGLPTITDVYPGLSQSGMRAVIHRERRIELAFENKRYFDLLRWKLAQVNLNGNLHGMEVQVNGSNTTYTIFNAARGLRTFDPGKNYVLPIPIDALSQNKNLTQNPNY